METKFTIITRHIEVDKLWKRSFNSEEEAINFKNIITNRNYDRHKVIGLIKEKKSGHRWCLYVNNSKKDGKKDILFFNSKKNCILASKLIKEYNKDLTTFCIKKY